MNRAVVTMAANVIPLERGTTYKMIDGKEYPVLGVVEHAANGNVPILDIPTMSDDRWNELAAKQDQTGGSCHREWTWSSYHELAKQYEQSAQLVYAIIRRKTKEKHTASGLRAFVLRKELAELYCMRREALEAARKLREYSARKEVTS